MSIEIKVTIWFNAIFYHLTIIMLFSQGRL